MSKRKGRTARIARQQRAQIRLIAKADVSMEGLRERDPELYSVLEELAWAQKKAQKIELEFMEDLVHEFETWEPVGIRGIFSESEYTFISQPYTEDEILDGVQEYKTLEEHRWRLGMREGSDE